MVDPLPATALVARCDAERLPFETTADLPALESAIGQSRAVEAIRFGLSMRRPGYNLFALGPPGIGKHDVVRLFLDQQAAGEETPSDWCYVNDFSDARRPRTLRLPAGRAATLRADVDRLLQELKAAIPAAFDREDYRARRKLLEDQYKQRQEEAFGEVERKARERGIAMIRTPVGLGLAPLRDGEVLDPEEFGKLPEEEQARLKSEIAGLQKDLQGVLASLPRWEREHRDELRKLDRQVTVYAAGHLVDELKRRYEDVPGVVEHLEAMQQDVVDNADEFLPSGETGEAATLKRALGTDGTLRRYRVNVIVDNGGRRGAPVVFCDHPTHPNLIGSIEHMSQLGALVTDFSLIKAGDLHRANGGYLMLDARKLLTQPYAWEQLKRSLRAREIRIETPFQSLGISSTVTLEPEPIPLDVKVVLIGDRSLYYLLAGYDTDMHDLFKVAADFDEVVPRSEQSELEYARFASGLARAEGLRPLGRDAVARLVEHGSRMASDGTRLSVRVQELGDLIREADHNAGSGGDGVVTAADLDAAIDARIRRADRVRERMQEEIQRGVILIDTQGERVGQVNALAVYQLGQFSFGRPNRITARVRMGTGNVVDIEREVQLGGPLHSKGVLILAGFLGQRYSADVPLSLSASLVFEQSYSGVDGDSASAAELFALLSAIAQAPLAQRFAVTGSVNQLGRIQPIGGVNEKIEGFFEVCRARGLTGEQAVVIPRANLPHLMLRREVVEAVEQGRFAVYPIETVDEGLELLTGQTPGERDESGRFPEDTLNAKIAARLASLALTARRFGRSPVTPGASDGSNDAGEQAKKGGEGE